MPRLATARRNGAQRPLFTRRLPFGALVLLVPFTQACSAPPVLPKTHRSAAPALEASGAAPSPPPATSLSQQPELHVRFVVDPGFDASHLFGILSASDPAGLASRAADMRIELETAEAIRKAGSLERARDTLAPLVDERYEREGKQLESARGQLERDWRALNGPLSRAVVEATGTGWIERDYVVVVSAFHLGLSDWQGHRVAVGARLDRAWRRRIAAHEITLAQLWKLLRRSHGEQPISDAVAWAFCEITTVLVLDTPRLRSFWPKVPAAGSYFTSSNYPQLVPFERKLAVLFKERTTFRGYMTEALHGLEGLNQASSSHGGVLETAGTANSDG